MTGKLVYPEYYKNYIAQVQDLDILQSLTKGMDRTISAMSKLSKEEQEKRYEPGKWTVKEVFGHVLDAERIFGYRALRIARGDKTSLPGFDENAFVSNANFRARSMESLIAEYKALRTSNIELFKSLDETALSRVGLANDKEVSVAALGYIIAGHERHHMGILASRYGLGELVSQ